MKRRHRKIISQLGGICWSGLAAAVEMYYMAARPGSYVFGRGLSLRHMDYFESKGWLEKEREKGEWVYRLTEEGKVAMSDGIDPEVLWNEEWDGQWRMFLFDLPARCKSERKRLNEWLKSEGFGCLQGSLWIRPRPFVAMPEPQEDLDVVTSRLMVAEAKVLGGCEPGEIVSQAWDFKEINTGYEQYLREVESLRKQRRQTGDPERLLTRRALDGWNRAAEGDPMLPKVLAPRGYLGFKAWQARCRFLGGK